MAKRKRNFKFSLIICSFCFILIILIPIEASNSIINIQPVWENFYDNYDERPTQLLHTSDGGFILVGSSILEDSSQTPWIIKVDSEGKEEWNKSYQPTVKPQGHLRSIINTSDGGYALGGFVFSSSENQKSWDLWVLKIDENGNEEWNRTFNGAEDGPDYAAQIVVAADGGFLISGATQSQFALPNETWNTDYWLIKIDANGIEEWNKTYHRIGSDQGTGLVPLTDGNYLLYGLSKQLNGAFSVWVIKIDENGVIIWNKAFDKETDWYGAWERNLIETADGGFLLTCYPFADSYTMGKDYWIIKCDSVGNIEWDTTFGGDYFDTPTVCLQSSKGDYYIGGAYNSPDGSEEKGDMCIVKLDSSGHILGNLTYGEVSWGERIVDMILVDSDEAIVALASAETDGTGHDFWLGKFEVDDFPPPTTKNISQELLPLFIGLSAVIIYQKNRKRGNR